MPRLNMQDQISAMLFVAGFFIPYDASQHQLMVGDLVVVDSPEYGISYQLFKGFTQDDLLEIGSIQVHPTHSNILKVLEPQLAPIVTKILDDPSVLKTLKV